MFFHVLHRIADLHGAGVGTQQIRRFGAAAFHIKRVMHRPRRVVLRCIERCEIEPVRLDLGAICHVKTHGRKNGLDALQRQGNRMQAALPALASG